MSTCTRRSPGLLSAAMFVLSCAVIELGCASSPRSPTAAAAATPSSAAASPVASAAGAAGARSLAPFLGEIASDDVPTFERTCDRLLADGRANIAALKAAPRAGGRAAVERALELYDEAGSALDTAESTASIIFNAHPDAAMRAAAASCEQRASTLATEITLDRGVYDTLAALDVAGEDAATRYWIDQDLSDFRRAGVNRDADTRARVKALRDELTAIGQKFEQNINDDTRKVSLDPSALACLPADFVAKHRPGSDGKVVLTTQYPDYIPFMSFARSSAAREQLFRAFRLRAHPQNVAVLSSLLQKRYELATLLGYPSWAAYSMENKMIRTPAAARAFIEQITRASDQRAAADYKLVLARLRKDDPNARSVPWWDASYLQQRVRTEQLDYDAQSVRPYFEFSRVKAGVLDITARMFGIEYRRVGNARVWHPDVEVYDVLDGGKRLGRIYLDLHPRAGKFSHAAQFSFVAGKEGMRLPEGVLLCNFPKPGDQPALMEHGDVKTFFHEFGHLVHHVFAGHTRWASTSGLRQSDFVEAPSQLLEEWVDDPTTLQTFALHYQTKQPIPTELVRLMRSAEEFGRGLDVRRQMVYAAVSLAYHDRDPRGLDPTRIFREMEMRYTPWTPTSGTFEELSFGHLEGYSSNYYTYMWSLVIAKDLLTPFHQAGLLDRTVARHYRQTVLEAGGTRPAADMVREFLGRPFGFKAYEDWLNAAAATPRQL